MRIVADGKWRKKWFSLEAGKYGDFFFPFYKSYIVGINNFIMNKKIKPKGDEFGISLYPLPGVAGQV